MKKDRGRMTMIAILAGGIALVGLLVRGMGPELVRYMRMRRM